jgi:hypothetical protein
VLGLVAVTACRALPPLEDGVCGNGVVEAGEDCDGAPDPARGDDLACAAASVAFACHYTCTASACPAGWACGGDGVCRHGTRAFDVELPFALAHTDLALADADGDGAAEVFAFDAHGARVRFSSGTIAVGPDPLAGPGALADLDGDGRVDLALPFALGLAIARGEPDRTMSSVGYAPFEVSASAAVTAVRVPDPAQGDAVALFAPSGPATDGTLVRLVLVPSGEGQVPVPLFDQIAPPQLGSRIARGDLDAPSRDDELVVAPPGARSATVLHMIRSIFGKLALTPQDLPLPACPRCPPPSTYTGTGDVFARDVDGDGDLDLVVGVAPDAAAVVTFTAGVPGPATIDTRFAKLGEPAAADGVLPGPRAVPLELADLDGDGALDAVSPDAVFFGGPAFTPIRARTTMVPWTEAVAVDLDGRAAIDGLRDVVVTSGGSGVDVLHHNVTSGGSGSDVHGFVRVPIATAGTTSGLRAGDFDGDGLGDVAFIEHLAGHDRLRVLFGDPGQLAPPAIAISASAIDRLEVGRFRDIQALNEGADDLVAVTHDGLRGGVAFVDGSGDRRLLSPLFLTRGSLLDAPIAVTAGGLLGGTADLAVLAESATQRRLWVWPTTAQAGYVIRTATILDVSGTLATLRPVRVATGDLDGDGRAEAIFLGLDSEGHARLVAVTVGDGTLRTVLDLELAIGAPLDLAVADADGDGHAELAIAGTTATLTWREGLIAPSPVVGRSLCYAQLDDDPALELAVLAADAVVIDGDAEHRLPVPAGATTLRAGDVDGDGLTDLVVGDGVAVSVWRSIPQVAR